MRQHKSNRKFTWLWKTAALSLAVMLIVHLLYSFDAPLTWLETAWGAGDLLGYWGSIIGAGATIFVLLATIDYEKKADEDRAKRSVRPVIAVSIPEKPFPRWGLVGLTIPEEDFDPIGEGAAYRKAREEYVRADCYAVVSKDGGVSYITKLRNDDYDLALWAEVQVNYGEGSSRYGNSFRAWFVKLVLVSIGNGPAINVRARIVGQNLGGVAYDERVTCSPATQLMVGGGVGLWDSSPRRKNRLKRVMSSSLLRRC